MNWGWLLLRIAIGFGVLTLLFLSQRFWFRSLLRISANWGHPGLRAAVRSLYVIALILVIAAAADGIRMGQGRIVPRGTLITMLAGLWFFTALFAFLAVTLVHGLERLWTLLRRSLRSALASASPIRAAPGVSGSRRAIELLRDPSRRYFFKSATAIAGVSPFLCAAYGFAAERLKYTIRRVEVPVDKLPSALDGMRIVQLSDIHLSGYMSRSEVRRAVDMANELGADLAVVTGDFITGPGDPLADCIDEIRLLHTPLGVWGCNGNHEIYARVEDEAERLFQEKGMRLLRARNQVIEHDGGRFNLIGVDYQRDHMVAGERTGPMLSEIEHLVRRDMPNILLSHNPNSFPRAAELGIELSLAGHTHGGQVKVEIVDHSVSPARLISPFVAGLYKLPMHQLPPMSSHPSGKAAGANGNSLTGDRSPLPANGTSRAALYVNRGLGTFGFPVRLGVPPEITLLTLRRA